MQVMRLVNGGEPDRIIAFDSLPKRLVSGLKTKDMAGFPRYWLAWMKDNGSVQEVGRWNAEYQRVDKFIQPFTYVLDYKLVNSDKERWQEIGVYVRRAVDLKVRLTDRLEEMAKPLAKDAYTELALDPEDIPIIPVPSELVEAPEPTSIITPEETIEIAPKKKAGRPKKIAVEA